MHTSLGGGRALPPLDLSHTLLCQATFPGRPPRPSQASAAPRRALRLRPWPHTRIDRRVDRATPPDSLREHRRQTFPRRSH
eukprot:9193-Chlamydomonas_euryale.AAC.1